MNGAGVVLRAGTTHDSGYYVYMGNGAMAIFKNRTIVARLTGLIAVTGTGTHTVRAVFDPTTGIIYGYLDGVLRAQYTDASPPSGTYAGFRANTAGLNLDFDNFGGTANTDFVPGTWDLVAQKGDTGVTGATGATGPAGLTWRGAWSVSQTTPSAMRSAVSAPPTGPMRRR